jgi:tRNA(Ile)-lysidine synthase
VLSPFEKSVLHRSLALIEPGQRVVVGVSGGSDSVALLAALSACALGLEAKLCAAHLDHGWRSPAEGEAERAAVAELCEGLGVELVSERVEAMSLHGSREAGARQARYAFFGRVAAQLGASAIAVGHTQDDQVETVMQRILRGTGLRGLGGIPARRRLGREQGGVWIVRPLLELTREEGQDYLRSRGLAWREDPSNGDESLFRNRVRRVVLPLLRDQGNPRVDEALLRLASQARGASRVLAAQAAALHEGAGLSLAGLRAADSAVRAEALTRLAQRHAGGGVDARHTRALQRVVRLGKGVLTLPGGVRLGVVGSRLEPLAHRASKTASLAAPPLALGIPGEALDAHSGLRFSARVLPVPAPREWTTDPAERVLLDAGRAHGVLAIRRRRGGDRFWPLGALGSRSLKRFFIDQKVPRESRDEIPVVTLDDRPVWIVGHRIDDHFKVTPSTVKVLELRASTTASG